MLSAPKIGHRPPGIGDALEAETVLASAVSCRSALDASRMSAASRLPTKGWM